VQLPSDPDDPKKQYKYPFTTCEVFCCEVEAIFNTLLEDEALLDLLFSLLDTEPPLSYKTAGYFGRVVGQLLLRKTNEMMQYLSSHEGLLEKLVRHLDVTSIADVIKRLAGADEQSSMVFLPMHTQWLVETPLLDMLLERLGPGWSSDAVTNAADILTAIAHTQPSALSAKLMQPSSISALFKRALEPGGKVLVPALEVCSALLEPRRALGLDMGGGGDQGMGGMSSLNMGVGGAGSSSSSGTPTAAAAAAKPRADTLRAMLVYLPQLVSFLASQDTDATQETPYGLLAPPLGRARLKVVELLAVLLHVGDEDVDSALIAANAMGLVMDLFAQYPFNNLLHHQVYYMLRGMLLRATPTMVSHTFGTCRLVGWLSGLPLEVTPLRRPGGPEPKGPLRAGYLGHVTRMAVLLRDAAEQKPLVAEALAADPEWQRYVDGELKRRTEIEDVTQWECGRPTSTEMGDMGSDGDDFQVSLRFF
jgi:serine/threonine-protein phosphatase 6 regulatory subunit 3